MEKLNDFDFHRTQIGFITECVEPILPIISLRDALNNFEDEKDLQAFPVELDSGYGILSREMLEQKKQSFRNLSRPIASLDLHEGSEYAINSRENVKKVFLKVTRGEVGELSHYVVYHNNNLMGIVSFHNIIRHVSDIQDYEVKQARVIQEHLLEHNLISDRAFQIQADIKRSQDLGGDYYYTASITDDLSMISCFDVKGDHISSSLISVMIDSYFKTRRLMGSMEKEDVEKLILSLNKFLLDQIPPEISVHAIFLFIKKSEAKVFLYNFGYTSPFLILSEEGKIRAKMVPPNFDPLGMEDMVIFREEPQVYNMADLRHIFIYSDGIEGCVDNFGESFGMERIKDCLVKNFKLLGEGFNRILIEKIDEFRKDVPLMDDLTTLIVSFT